MSSPSSPKIATLPVALVPLGILINLGLGTLVHALRLPLFVDSVGTIIMTLLLGWRWGAATGVLSFLVGGMLVNPVLPWFSGTQLVIAVVTAILASMGGFRLLPRVIGSGIIIGICAAVASAPVIIYLFGGITGSGSGAITAFLLASGKKIIESVILTGISCEPVDKVLQACLAYYALKSLPERLQRQFPSLAKLRGQTHDYESAV